MASPASPIISDEDHDVTLVSNDVSVGTPTASLSSSGRSESPLRKRARYEECDRELTVEHNDVMEEKADLSMGPRKIVRDATYYMMDGSCVLLVEDTLFNVFVFRNLLANLLGINY